MSNLNVAKKAQEWEQLLINGYFRIHFSALAPKELIQTCIIYCVLLEGFDATLHSNNIQINGVSHTLCECTQLAQTVQYGIGRNIFAQNKDKNKCTEPKTEETKSERIPIKAEQHCRIIGLEYRGPSIVKTVSFNEDTQRWKVSDTSEEETVDIKEENLEIITDYNPFDSNVHWRFEIKSLKGPNGGGIIFGIVENTKDLFSKRLKIATSLASSSVKAGDYVDLYLDLNERSMMFIRNGWDFMGTLKVKPTEIGYRFCIQFIEAFGAIEFIEYHESNWFMHNLSNATLKTETFDISRNEAICHAGLALTKPLFEFNHFVIALSLYPTVQRWVDGLIFSIICGERTNYELSFESALRYQPKGSGGESVGYLAKIYYNQGIYDKALVLLKLLHQTYVNENKLNDAIAMCLAVMGNKEESVKYCDLHSKNIEKFDDIESDHKTENESVNISAENEESSDEKQQNMYMDQIAFCYEDVDDKKAIQYYQNAIDKNNRINTIEWIQARMGALYTKLKPQNFEAARKCYQNIIDIKPNHYLSYFNYGEFLRNLEKYNEEKANELKEDMSGASVKEEKDSKEYYQKALELALGSVGGSDDEDVVLTIIDCYRMLKDFEMAIKYLKIYLQNYSSDNIGIIMILKDCYIEIEDYGNAISCLHKLFAIDENVFEYNFEYAELLRIHEKDQPKSNLYYQKAVEIGEKLLSELKKEEIESSHAHLYEMLSICFENLDKDLCAIKYYILHLNNGSESNNGNGKDILTMNKLANAYFRMKDYTNASKWFLKAIAIGNANNDKLVYLIYYDYAMFLEDIKQIKESKIYIRKSIQLCSELKQKRRVSKSEITKESIEKDLTEFIHISSCFVQLKEYENVKKWLDSAQNIISEQKSLKVSEQKLNFNGGFMDEFNLNCALCYLLFDKDYESSLKYLLLIDDNTMKKCGLYAIASCIHRGFRDIRSAFECANVGVIHSSEINGIMVHSAMAILLNETGKYSEADKNFQIALNIDSQQKDFELIESYSESLEHYFKNYEKSLIYAKLLIKIACDDSEICRSHIRMATVYHYLDNTAESEKCFDLSLQYFEKITNSLEKEYIYQTFGYYYLITQKYDKCLNYLLNSYRIDPREPGITGLVGICLYEMNKKCESKEYLCKSVTDCIEINDPFLGPKVLLYYSNILFNESKSNETNQKYNECIALLLANEEIFTKKFANHCNSDEFYYLISRCYSKLCEFGNAFKYLEIANKINPNRKIYQNQMKLIEKIKVTDHEEYV